MDTSAEYVPLRHLPTVVQLIMELHFEFTASCKLGRAWKCNIIYTCVFLIFPLTELIGMHCRIRALDTIRCYLRFELNVGHLLIIVYACMRLTTDSKIQDYIIGYRYILSKDT